MKVSLIVLNYNGVSLLKEYFDSVTKQSTRLHEIFMLDNHSTDNSVDFVREHYPFVQVIQTKKNYGTAEGSNLAFENVSGELVIFQSNDVRLDRNCVRELIRFMNVYPDCGVCSSVLLQKQTKIIDNTGGICDIFGYPMQKYPNLNLKDIPDFEEVFFSYGGSFIVRREVFEKVGGFDKRFFTLNDDLDFCWRVKKAGYKIYYMKKSFVGHKGSATLKNLFNRPQKHYWSERNMFRSYLKNQSLLFLLLFLPGYIFLLFAEMSYFLYRLKFSLFWADLKAIFWNLVYLPETMLLRFKMFYSGKKRLTLSQFSLISFKLKLFKDFKKVL
jgi:GT2 family glycosyltransferase